MSDQTQDTTQDVADGNEPSMEDILASIRKIIADDGADDVKTDAVGAALSDDSGDILKPILTDEIPQIEPGETLSLQAVPADDVNDAQIDAMLEDLGGSDPAFVADNAIDSDIEVASIDFASEDSVLDLEIPFLDDSGTVELSSADIAPVAENAAPENAEPEVLEPVSEDMDDDLTLMLDNMIKDESPAAALDTDELSALKDEITPKELPETLEDVLTIEDLDEGEPLELTPSEGESDMDLVKSLMADLTEKPFSVDDMDAELEDFPAEMPAAENIESEISIPDSDEDSELKESLDALISDDDIEDDDSTDMMDEILNMTLYDEASLQESTIAAETELTQAPDGVDIAGLEIPELETSELETSELELSELEIPELDIPEPDISEPAQDAATPLSLQDIAQAAKSDASGLEGGSPLAALGGGLAAAGAAVGVASLSNNEGQDAAEETVSALQTPVDVDSLLSRLDSIIETPEDDLSDAELDELDEVDIVDTLEIPQPDTLTEEIPQMPRAVKSDAIIDEVTKTATADAFASLNQAVEEKAVVAERGDRIGDLVMESLRPMLKEWLDANLKGIVERAVTKEVKRISSGK